MHFNVYQGEIEKVFIPFIIRLLFHLHVNIEKIYIGITRHSKHQLPIAQKAQYCAPLNYN